MVLATAFKKRPLVKSGLLLLPSPGKASSYERKSLEESPGGLRGGVQHGLPTARLTGLHVFRAIIQIQYFSSTKTGHLLHNLVKSSLGLHGFMLVGKDIAIEVPKKGILSPNKTDGQIVGVRKDINRNTNAPQLGLQLDHRNNWGENVTKIATEDFIICLEADGFFHGRNKLGSFQQPSFILIQRRSGEQYPMNFDCLNRGMSRQVSSRPRPIKIHQHLSKIEDHRTRFH